MSYINTLIIGKSNRIPTGNRPSVSPKPNKDNRNAPSLLVISLSLPSPGKKLT